MWGATTFEEDITPVCCSRGFHFCKELKDCFKYYEFNPNNKVAKVVALGEIDETSDHSKCCTNKIQIVEEKSRRISPSVTPHRPSVCGEYINKYNFIVSGFRAEFLMYKNSQTTR